MAGKSVESRWTLKDLFSPAVKQATSSVGQFRTALGEADVAGKAFAKSQAEDAAALMKQKAAVKECKSMMGEFGETLKTVFPFLEIAGVAAFGEAIRSAQEFQNQMSQVGTLLNETGQQGTARLNQLSNQVMAISRESGASLEDLSSGMYQVISAFGDTADAAKQLEIADRAATAGNSTVSDSVNLLSAVMKGYGDTSIAMEQKVSDLAMQTVRLGKTTYPELAASMSQVTSSANVMGVSVQELFATQATLAVSLGGASEVATDMASALKALMAPSKQMKASLDSLGYSSGQALVKAKGFKGALQELVQSTHGNTQELAKMFGRVEGMKLAIQLAGSASKSYDQNLKAMQNSVGATDRAYEAATNTLNHKWKVAVNDVVTGVIEMINKFHVLQGLSAVLGAFSEHFRAITTAVATVTTAVTAYVAITKTAQLATAAAAYVQTLWKTGLVTSAVATDGATIATWSLNAALRANPIGAVVTGLSLLAMGAVWVATHWQGTKLIWMEVWNAIVKATQVAVNIGIDLVNNYMRVYKYAFDAIKYAGVSIWDGIVKGAQDGINKLLKLISPLSGILKHVGINLPSSVNFGGVIANVSAPKWDTSFGFQHVNLAGGMYTAAQVNEQHAKATGELIATMKQHKQSLDANTRAVAANSKSTDGNTAATNANTAKNSKLKGDGMSAEEIADKLMPRLERHLYGTTTA